MTGPRAARIVLSWRQMQRDDHGLRVGGSTTLWAARNRGGAGVNVDVVVVGAGSSGIALACRLSEDPGRSVLLVEAGLGGPLFSDADRLSNVSFATTQRNWALRALVSGGR